MTETLGSKLLQYAEAQGLATLPSTSALDILGAMIPPPDQCLRDFVDVGDIMAIIGKSKSRKSWFALQLALCLATGKSFLEWPSVRPHTVLLVQMEVTPNHYARRVQRVVNSMFPVGAHFVNSLTNLRIINGRGKGVTIDQISQVADLHNAEVVMIDPIYTLLAEEGEEEVKRLVGVFGKMAENRTVVYVHHDKKGNSGDHDLVDRGSGSGVLGRAYDAACYIDAHAESDTHSVISNMTRNYARKDSFAVTWENFLFEVDDGSEAMIRTSLSETRKAQRGVPLNELLTPAEKILRPQGIVWANEAKLMLQEALVLGEKKAGQLLDRLRDPGYGMYTEEIAAHGRRRLLPRDVKSVWE